MNPLDDHRISDLTKLIKIRTGIRKILVKAKLPVSMIDDIVKHYKTKGRDMTKKEFDRILTKHGVRTNKVITSNDIKSTAKKLYGKRKRGEHDQ